MLARTGEGGEAEEGRHGTAGTPVKKRFAQEDNNVKTDRTLLEEEGQGVHLISRRGGGRNRRRVL